MNFTTQILFAQKKEVVIKCIDFCNLLNMDFLVTSIPWVNMLITINIFRFYERNFDGNHVFGVIVPKSWPQMFYEHMFYSFQPPLETIVLLLRERNINP